MLASSATSFGTRLVDRVRIVAAQRVLIFGRRLPPADMQVLLRLQEQPRPGDAVELGPQALTISVAARRAPRAASAR
jgi:hypothetical protein